MSKQTKTILWIVVGAAVIYRFWYQTASGPGTANTSSVTTTVTT